MQRKYTAAGFWRPTATNHQAGQRFWHMFSGNWPAVRAVGIDNFWFLSHRFYDTKDRIISKCPHPQTCSYPTTEGFRASETNKSTKIAPVLPKIRQGALKEAYLFPPPLSHLVDLGSFAVKRLLSSNATGSYFRYVNPSYTDGTFCRTGV